MKLSELSTKPDKGLIEATIRSETESICKKIGDLQQILYAEAKQSLLVILQGMDASGKDGAIKGVFSAVNPMGVQVIAFKKPTEQEYRHDFLWRVHQQTPPQGMIHIFNRSHYEDILMPSILGLYSEKVIRKRYGDINNFEELLENNNTKVLKFYLHVSPDEQMERLKERMSNPKKYWKHKDADWEYSKKWNEFMSIYESLFDKCNKIPWTIVPSDKNWYKEYLVGSEVLKALEKMNPQYPPLVTSMKPQKS
ncbi:MAG TPA: PPK2 family polyphosphate kinase [Bacteroidia bacterium]|nr:PPK2 family polyphosphate kinase [Bacteroidia bacterium]